MLVYKEDVLSTPCDCFEPQTIITEATAGFPPLTMHVKLNSFPAIRSVVENDNTGAEEGGSVIKDTELIDIK